MFRLISVAGRSALQTGRQWHDLAATASDPTLADPMVAIARHADLHAVQNAAASREPDGAIADVTLGVCVPRPAMVFAIDQHDGAVAAHLR